MFGLRLKSWMEAHLGRPRHKSTNHQNQKHQRAPKDSSTSAGGTSSIGSSVALASNNTATTATSSYGGLSSSSNSGNSYPTALDLSPEEQNSNLDCSPSSDFSSTTNPTTSPSCSSVQQSLVDPVRAQQQQYQKQQEKSTNSNTKEDEKDQDQHQRSTCTRSSTTGSVANSTSNSILLGSFSNNLSSPDTGYSTDGYSPKSVYPALSFESSGKSTPKSSYTISSLVSSELLHSKQTGASLSSASCSVQNGLELDHECVSPLPTESIQQPLQEVESKGNSYLSIGGTKSSPIDNNIGRRNPKGESLIVLKHEEHQLSTPSHSINHGTPVVSVLSPTAYSTCSSEDPSRGNDTVTNKQYNSASPSQLTHVNESSSHCNTKNMVAPTPTPRASNFTINNSNQSQSNDKGNCKLNDFTGLSKSIMKNNNNAASDGISSFSPGNNNKNCGNLITNRHNNQHRRSESMDEEKSKKVLDDGDSSGDSSSLLTGHNRNIRTSFVLVTTAASQIPECNPALKNAFSICSPRKERTRIKTNPWITISQHNSNDGNSNANTESINAVVVDSHRRTKSQDHSHSSPSPVSESSRMEKAAFHPNISSVDKNLHTSIGKDSSKGILEINKEDKTEEKGRISGGGCTGEEMDHHHHDSSSPVYRISTSTNASDSGKGSLEPGTNRNSTESSCLLSDSTASTRNSIISHEAELGGSETRSRSSTGSTDTFDNGHGQGTFFQQNNSTQRVSGTEQQSQSYHQQCVSTINPVNNNCGSTPSNSAKESKRSTPICMGFNKSSSPKGKDASMSSHRNHNSSHFSEPKSEQDVTVTSTSITLPPELISASAKTNIMVDKETDILSDWANTDDDGDDEIETDQNDNEGVTPTPSSPDTDTGGRAIFPNSQSTSSATDIDFGDSSAATAASSTGILLSSSNLRHHHHYNQSINNHSSGVAASGISNGSTSGVAPSSFHHHNMINLPTTCYQPIQILPAQGMIPVEMYVQDRKEAYCNQSEPLGNHHVLIQPTDVLGHSNGIPNANISLSSLYTHPSSIDSTDFINANKPSSSSHAIARGALGFLRKIFKKGSCSSQRTSPGSSNKVKLSRSSKGNKDSYHNHNIPSVVTGLRSPLLTADALVSPNPLVNRKASLNGYFLTPTPNAFRRRSGTGTDSSDSKSSKHNNHHPSKSVKTDIIRLPPGALSPNPHGHSGSSSNNILQTSSSSTTSSQNNSTGAFCISSLQNNTFAIGTNNDSKNGNGHSNTNTNSTTASSVHSMSTSISAASATNANNNGNSKTTRQNQSRPNGDNLYSNSKGQSPFLSNQHQNAGYIISPILNPPSTTGPHSAMPRAQPQLPVGPMVPSSSSSSHSSNHPSQVIYYHHHPHQGDFSPHPSMPATTTKGACPYESPRLQNAPTPPHRINSPSFNNYSPIHRLVVTGANHLLNRGPSTANPCSHQPSHLVQQIHSASSQYHSNNPHVTIPTSTVGESPQLTSRQGKLPSTSHTHTNNANAHHNNSFIASGTTTFTPVINRSVHHPSSTPSPLINHCQSISSPHHNSHQPTSSSCHPQGSHTSSFASPSPILRNPRYQYITSSNQNSPILNVPKRINLPQTQQQQNYPYPHNNHGVVSAVVSIPQQPPPPAPLNPNGHGPPPFSTFSPVPPPRQNANANHNNPFSAASPNLNHHQQHQQFTPTRRHRSSSIGCEFENANAPNLQPVVVALQTQGNIPSSSPSNRSNILSRSQSYQTHQIHYYASPVIPQPPPPLPPQTTVSPAVSTQQPRMHPQTILPSGFVLNEPPLLMKTHLHNQNIRLNNFLMNKQRYHHQNNSLNVGSTDGNTGDRNTRFPNSESFQERIYETVDSEDEDEDDYSDEPDDPNFIGDVTNRRISAHEIQQRHINSMQQNKSSYRDYQNNGSSGSVINTNIDNGRSNNMPEPSFHYGQSNTSSRARNQQQSMKSRRSKPKTLSSSQKSQYHQSSAGICPQQQQIQPRPPVPMALFGPNTFLSETETKVLLTESDREADRKYKRLINEAEALLREISAVKSQTPWAYRSDQDRLRAEDCPQSDPLRRKAYDCWALRRLQQELAGCCASPPVLHRSRMNLQSPSTPTASTHPYLTAGNLSIVHNHGQDPSQIMNPNHIDNNRNNAHF